MEKKKISKPNLTDEKNFNNFISRNKFFKFISEYKLLNSSPLYRIKGASQGKM